MFSFADQNLPSIPVYPVYAEDDLFHAVPASPSAEAWVRLHDFTGKFGQTLVLPSQAGTAHAVVYGLGAKSRKSRERFALAPMVASLPKGVYRIEGPFDQNWLERECLGLLLTQYRFEDFAKHPRKEIAFQAPDTIDADQVCSMAKAEALTRDLINRPANMLTPSALEQAALDLAARFGAQAQSWVGDGLLEQNFPLIYAVGAAALEKPRLVELRWGSVGPKITLVGKGVVFDTGGLNLKPSASMGLMKKDMGGAAQVLGLAQMIMQRGDRVQLRVLLPIAENSVASKAMRPGDIYRARNGLTVEVNNTDAEGRLILADALAFADEEKPDVMISMATLTGAARVALGPDMPALFCDDDALASALTRAGSVWADPLWRMPFWEPYETLIEPGVADLDNAPKGGWAGAITAALFLRRFVSETPRYAHLDLFGWNPNGADGQSKGGMMSGPRAIFHALPGIF